MNKHIYMYHSKFYIIFQLYSYINVTINYNDSYLIKPIFIGPLKLLFTDTFNNF